MLIRCLNLLDRARHWPRRLTHVVATLGLRGGPPSRWLAPCDDTSIHRVNVRRRWRGRVVVRATSTLKRYHQTCDHRKPTSQLVNPLLRHI